MSKERVFGATTPHPRFQKTSCEEGASGHLRSSLTGGHRRDPGSGKWVILKASLGEALELKNTLESTVRMNTEPNLQCFFFFFTQGP